MDKIKRLISQIGYNLKLPGAGISEPAGTKYDKNRTPSNVYLQNAFGVTNPSKQSILPATAQRRSTTTPTDNSVTTSYTLSQSPSGSTDQSGGTADTSGMSYEDQLALARQQALDSLKARLGVINTDIEAGKSEALKNRDTMAGNIGNAFGIFQSGDWGNPTYNDISVGTGDLNSQFDLAKQRWYNENAPQSLLSQLYNTLATGRTNLGTERTNVASLYGDENAGTGLLGAAKNTQQTQDRALNQSDIDTINKYSNAGGIARRAMESALNKNRMMARAGGRLGSSFYDQLQGDVTNTGAKTVSDVAREEAGKRTDIAGKRTDLQNWLTKQLADYKAEKEIKGEAIDQKEVDMFNEMIRKSGEVKTGATGQYQQVGTDYTNAINEANKLKSLNDINYSDLENGVEQNYMTGLQNIQNYLQNKELQKNAIAATAGGYNTGYNVYTPNSKGYNISNDIGSKTTVEDLVKNAQPGTNDLLSRISNINPGIDTVNALPGTFNNMASNLNALPTNDANLTDIIAMLTNPKKKNTLEDYLYGGAATA